MPRTTVERNISYDTQRHVYYVCMDGGRSSDGQRYRFYRTAPSLKKARKLLLDFQIQKQRGCLIRPTSQTLEQWLEYWLEEIILPTRAATTVYSYRKIIYNHILPAIGQIQLQRLSPQEIQSYYSMLLREKQLSSNTIRKHHDLLSAALHSAVRHDILPNCPLDRVEPPRSLPAEIAFYDAASLRRLFSLVKGTPLEIPVRLAGALGLRREEICGLKWDQVDFEHRLIHIRFVRTSAGGCIIEKEPKNTSSLRTLHMSNELHSLLLRETWRQDTLRQTQPEQWPDSGFVVVDPNGTPPTPDALSYSFSRFIKRSGLPPLTLHGLRHSFATVASQQGVPLFEIGKALGHSTPATTGKVYTHLTDSTHSSALLRVADAVR